MILLERPWLLLAALPWAALCGLLYYRQLEAIAWVRANTSERFSSAFTRYTPKTLVLHMVFLFGLGLSALVAAAGPYSRGLVEKEEASGDIAIVLDASFSMAATDVGKAGDGDDTKATGSKLRKRSRLDAARAFSAQLIQEMPAHRFALISFSGIPAIHSPPTTDHAALITYLGTLTLHSFRATGSSFGAAFAGLLHITQHHDRPFQVVLISDGELPQPDQYSDELTALKNKNVRIHTLAVGSNRGSKLTIYDPEDLRANRRPPRVAKKVTTRRVDAELKKIASATGGSFHLLQKTSASQIKEILEAHPGSRALARSPGRNDLSRFPLACFLALFLLETLVLSGRARVVAGALGLLPLAMASVIVGGCGNQLNRAHVRNEQGIALFHLQRHEEARAEFEASAGLAARDEIPTYNEGGNLFAQRAFATAHKKYEQAIEMSPDLVEALYNDGHTLYRWGQSELNPKSADHCRQERTRRLWGQALIRFRRAADHDAADRDLIAQAHRNASFVTEQLKALDRFEKECPAQAPKSESSAKKEKPEREKGEPEQKGEPPQKKKGNASKSAGNGQKQNAQGQSGQQEQDGPGQPHKKGRNGDIASNTRGMTRADQDRVNEELKRIRAQARQGKRHLQSKAQQMPGRGTAGPKKTKGRAGGRAIWW